MTIKNNRLLRCFKKHKRRCKKEYSKRMLTFIVVNSMAMMWASYVLAYIGNAEIAESLSKTIGTSIITVVVGYLAKSTIENISKNTTAFGENVEPIRPHCESEDIDC